MRRERNEEDSSRVPKAKPVPGGILPGRAANLSQGFDESLLGLQKAIGNQGVLRMLRDEGNGNDNSEKLDASVRGVMESRFGADLGGVCVHRGGSAAAAARQINSAAFTMGKDIFFGAGRYAPHTPEGTQLLAHELTHVLQQQKGGTGAGAPPGAAHEAEASIAAGGIAAGSPRVNVQQASGPGIAKQKEPAPPAPQVVVQNLYTYTFEGKTVTLTEEQYKAEIAKVTAQMSREFSIVQNGRDAGREAHIDFMENTHGLVGSISDILGDTVPPTLNIWSWPMSAIEQGRVALKEGRIKDAARFLKHAREDLKEAEHEWHSYINATISGAEAAVSDLETVRDVSFSIAIGTAAVVAAPVIAAGLAEAGVTGVAGTLATGGAVTAGGAGVGGVLQGGTSIVGQGIATGHVDLGKAWQETKEGAKHGAIDASTALVTAGTGRLLGKGTTVAGKVVRHAATGAAGGAFSSGVTAVSEGKSAGEVFESTGIGAVSGFAGGAVTSRLGGSAAQQSTTRRVLSGAAGSVASGTTATVLSGGSTADIKRAVATSAITGVATSAATPTHGGPTTEETPPKGKEPTHAASPEAGRASAVPDPAEIFSAPKKILSKLTPREKIEQLRLKKLAVHAQVEEKAAAPAKEEKSNVRSLDEFRQRKAAAAAAKKPQPPTEAAVQAQPVALEQTAEAEMKLAAGAESQGMPVAGKSVAEESRLKIVASGGGGGGRSRPGGDLRHVSEFREREFGRNTPSLKTVRSGPSTLSEHLEELEATKSIRDLRKGRNRNLVDTEAQLHREIGKAIEPVEVEIFGGDLKAKGASSVVPNHEFPPWLQKIFPSSAKSTRSTVRGGPDLVAIDEKNGRIHVGDVTAKASGSHLAKTAAYAREIAAALPENYADFEVVAQERYYGAEQEYSDVVVVKPGTGKRSK